MGIPRLLMKDHFKKMEASSSCYADHAVRTHPNRIDLSPLPLDSVARKREDDSESVHRPRHVRNVQ
jgi:hypothetical protein